MARDRLLLVGFPDRTHRRLMERLREQYDLMHFEGSASGNEPVLAPRPFRFQWHCLWGAFEQWRRIRGMAEGLRCSAWERLALLLKLVGQVRRVSLARMAARDLFRQGRIKAVLTITDTLGPYRAIIEEANAAGLPTLLVYHGASCNVPTSRFNIHHRELMRPRAQITFVETPPEIDYVKEAFNLDDRSVVSVGPLTDQGHDPQSRRGQVQTQRICYIAGYPASWSLSSVVHDDLHEHRCFEGVCLAWQSLNPLPTGVRRELVFRPHPALRGILGVSQWSHFQHLAARHGIELIHDDGMGLDAVLGADLVVTSYPSSVAYTTTLAGIPSLCIVPEWIRSMTCVKNGHKVSWLMEKDLCVGVGMDGLTETMSRLLEEGTSGRYRERVRTTLMANHPASVASAKSFDAILQEACGN